MAPALIRRNARRITTSMVKARPYYAAGSASAAHYDLITAADPFLAGDTAIYANLCQPGGDILELGAGTGRLSAAFAEQGFSVTGIDISPVMLAQARARIAALPREIAARVSLAQGDMTALSLGRTFDLVACAFFTLAHVPAGAAWRNTFAAAARHLGPKGLAAFHLPRIEAMRLPAAADPTRPVFEAPLADDGRLALFLRERTFREGPGRFDQTLDYVEFDARGREARRSTERLTYYMTDPTPLAAGAGLALDRPPIEVGGVGDVWVFRKA